MNIRSITPESRTINGEQVETLRVDLELDPAELPEDERLEGFPIFQGCIVTLAKPPKAQVLQGQLRAIAVDLPDELAVRHPKIYPVLTNSGEAVPANTRINWQGQVAKAKVTLWDRADQWPGAAPELWDILQIQGDYRMIPEVITAALAFAPGEKGWWKEILYENVSGVAMTHNPDQYPQGWKVVAR